MSLPPKSPRFKINLNAGYKPGSAEPTGQDDKCQLCAEEWKKGDDQDKRNCSDCGLYVCRKCGPTYILKTLGENNTRQICAKCIVGVKREVEIKKSPRGIKALKNIAKKKCCPLCTKPFDKQLRSECHCFECRNSRCVTCAPRYRLVSLGEDFDRRICSGCINVVKQRITAAAPQPTGAFGMRVRTGTAIRDQGVKKKQPQAETDDAVGEEEAPPVPATKPAPTQETAEAHQSSDEPEHEPEPEPEPEPESEPEPEAEEKKPEPAVESAAKPVRKPELAGEVKTRGETQAVRVVNVESVPEAKPQPEPNKDEAKVLVMKRPGIRLMNRRATVMVGQTPELNIVVGEAETQML